MQHQKDLFSLPDDSIYINGAYMSPQLKSVEKTGIESILRKNQPHTITQEDFFTNRTILKQRFAQLIDAPDYHNCAIIPAASYGIATAANNIDLKQSDEILLVDEQFPSNVYAWREKANETGASIRIVRPPTSFKDRSLRWNQNILKAINANTKVVAMGHVHWADGSLFDLIAIRKKSHEVGAKLIIDGTQSVGALPFSVAEIQPDALICGGYKWLMGPYAIGMAYYADSMLDGEPLEYNWINRKNSEDFSQLINYQDEYQPKADKFCVGESSNFILVPMQIAAIDQLLQWGQKEIQAYTHQISQKAITALRAKGCFIENDAHRAKHLFGVYLPEHMHLDVIKERFRESGISVGIRGAPHVYNTTADFEQFLACFD
ncbi:MAG: selenocysteine lyase/cysteine desulfurase [Flavobacteriales bacterium]|jgi:selenocysteine lyase/cysteine desulfurase